MLAELQIDNVAVIAHERVSFFPGLNVLTGETGAGKSVVLHALEFVLGARASATLIRAGAEQCSVEALFRMDEVPEAIRRELPEIAQGDELLVSRTLNRAGRARVSINGRLATVALLSEVCSKVLNICTQNQQVRLLEPRFHLQLIDDYAGAAALHTEYQALYEEWRSLRALMLDWSAAQASRSEREESLRETVAEISKAHVRPGIRAELEEQVRRLSNVTQILERAAAVQELLRADDGLDSSVGALVSALQELTRLDGTLLPLRERGEQLRIDLRELGSDLERGVQRLSTDDETLLRLRDQLAEIARLERKYRMNDAGLVDLLTRSEAELAQLSGHEGIGGSTARLEALQEQMRTLAAQLSKTRLSAGKKLAQAAAKELADLNMASCSVEIAQQVTDFGPHGTDMIELMVRTNRGEALRPLREVASGGELSRLMLVLKKLLRERSGVTVLVFDEVDTGISGRVARAVGEKLKQLAEVSQVLCITHLPQVASLADHHFVVNKREQKGRVEAAVAKLNDAQRVDEIARMLSGHEITKAARASAVELLAGNG